MDTLLAVIAFLGLGALLIAAFVFASAARRYVGGTSAHEQTLEQQEVEVDSQGYREAAAPDPPRRRRWNRRSSYDRRRNTGPVSFPIMIDGQLIAADRRRGERRRNRVA